MSSPISPIRFPMPIETAGSQRAVPERAFETVLEHAIERVEGFRRDADASVDRLLSGEGGELHATVLATQRAELAFETFVQVRNKVVQAYQEIMRMQM